MEMMEEKGKWREENYVIRSLLTINEKVPWQRPESKLPKITLLGISARISGSIILLLYR